MPISSLAYVGLGVSDPASWCLATADVLGFVDVGEAPTGEHRLRIDARPWRFAIHEAPNNDIIYAGFEIDDQREADRMLAELSAAGIEANPLTREQSNRRSVSGGIALRDPDGLAIELVYGFDTAATDFRSPRDVNFVTGNQGLGHIVLSAADATRTLEFYQTLGFRVSDYIKAELGPGFEVDLVFLHCNQRHHTLALLPVPTPKRLNHLMLEVDSVDSVIQAYYRAQKKSLPIVRHIGRHTNDRMLSFYCRTPAGFDVEYGWGALRIGDDWQVQHFNGISIWGHEGR